MSRQAPRWFRTATRFLGSLKVLFWLTTALALLSLVGAFILQRGPAWAYLELYGEFGAGLISTLGLDDIFGAFYFILLVFVFFLSLTVCLGRRLRARLRRRDGDFTPDYVFASSTEPRQFITLTAARLKQRGWRVSKSPDNALDAELRGWGWWASGALHLGMALFLLAGLFKLFLGESALLVLFRGQPQLLPPSLGELEVVSPDFDTLRDPNSGRVLTYFTELESWTAEEPEPERARVEVNHPYRRSGVAFYQYLVDERAPVELYCGPAPELESYVSSLAEHLHATLRPTAVEIRAMDPPREFTTLEEPVAAPDERTVEGDEEAGPAVESPAVEPPGTNAETAELEPAAPEVEAAGLAVVRPAVGGGFVKAPITGEPVALPGTPYTVRLLDYVAADPLGMPPRPTAFVELLRDGEVLVARAAVFERAVGRPDPALLELDLHLVMGGVHHTSVPRPALPASIEVHRLWAGDYDGEGTWLSTRSAGPLFVGFQSGPGLVLTSAAGDKTALSRPFDDDPLAVVKLDTENAAAYRHGEPEPVSGLHAKRDPGLYLFWPAVVLTALGSLLLLFSPHRRLRLRLREGRLEIKAGPMTEAEVRRLLSPEGGGL